MINLLQPELEFLTILGMDRTDLIKIFNNSKNEDDFVKELCIDSCIEQFELDAQTAFELKEKILSIAYKNYREIKND